MKWTVGYQLTESDTFMHELLRRRADIHEVYFAWGTMPNGRHAAAAHERLTESEARRRTEADLQMLADHGIALNLLLNGNCYGARSLSRRFFTEVCETVDELGERFGLASVTTTSPVLAELVKRNFPQLELRASVNMAVGTSEALSYLSDIFDGFYLQRELNRDLPKLRTLSAWCSAHGKKTYLLANSGCLNHCPARTFHDNLVAHEREIAERDNAVQFHGLCADYFKRTTDKSDLLSRLNFIRPEDMGLYEGLVTAAKLATRVSRYPSQILRAYAEGHYSGNLLDLLEPSHAEQYYPLVIENSKLPPDFGERVSQCGQVCTQGACDYCAAALQQATVRLPDPVVSESGMPCGSNHTNHD